MDKSIIPYRPCDKDLFADGPVCYGMNIWVENVNDVDVILSDYHDGVAQVLVLNSASNEINFHSCNIQSICFNFSSRYGICTKLWIKVQTEPRWGE